MRISITSNYDLTLRSPGKALRPAILRFAAALAALILRLRPAGCDLGSSKSGSRCDPHPQRLSIFHLILGGRSESLLRETWSESPGNCSGSSFLPHQVLLSKNFHPRPGCRQKSLLRRSRVGGGGQNSILTKHHKNRGGLGLRSQIAAG